MQKYWTSLDLDKSKLPGVERFSREAGGDSRPLGLLEAWKRLVGNLPEAVRWPLDAAAAAAANMEERF